MKYYIDRVWYSVQDETWYSCEIPNHEYFTHKETAEMICDVLNDTKILGDNEKYIVVEVEEWKGILC